MTNAQFDALTYKACGVAFFCFCVIVFWGG